MDDDLHLGSAEEVFDHDIYDAAWEVARASHERDARALDQVDLLVDALGSGNAGPYRRGAADALAAVVTSLRQRTLSHEARALVLRGRRALVWNAVAASPGRSQKSLAEDVLDMPPSQVSDILSDLRRAGLIEAAASTMPGNSWQLSTWGRSVARQLADDLRERLTAEQFASGLGRPDLEVDAPMPRILDTPMLGESRVIRRLESRREASALPALSSSFDGGLEVEPQLAR